jgi:hypothetical protein
MPRDSNLFIWNSFHGSAEPQRPLLQRVVALKWLDHFLPDGLGMGPDPS